MKITMQQFSAIQALFSILFLYNLSLAQTVTLINPGTDDRIQSITGLDIAGTTYDVTFQHGISYNAIVGTPITFSTQPEAAVALEQIRLVGMGITPATTNITRTVRVPYEEAGILYWNQVGGISGPPDTYSDWFVSQTFNINGRADNIGSTAAFATFATSTAAVPEPTTFALAGALSVGAIVFRRRRKNVPVKAV